MLAKPSLTLKRRLKAAPGKVFQAWTDPEKIVHWFGPRATVAGSVRAEAGATGPVDVAEIRGVEAGEPLTEREHLAGPDRKAGRSQLPSEAGERRQHLGDAAVAVSHRPGSAPGLLGCARCRRDP